MAVDNSKIVDLNKRFVSPKGILEPYAYLNRPDYGHGHFANERGKYKAALTFSADDPQVQKLIAFVEDVYNKTYDTYLADYKANPPPVARGKKALEPYQGDLPFIENGDGTVTFRFDAWASFIDKKTQEVKQINLTYADAKGKPIKTKDLPSIFGGSELRTSFKVLPYGWSNVAGASVKLQLQGVMLINVVESSGGGEFGEFAEEGGFEASEREERTEFSQGDDDDTPPFRADSGDGDDNLGTQGGDF